MKKCVLLFVILIAILTLTLVAFACQEDRAVETAQAFYSYQYAENGIVKPNILNYSDFSNVQTTSFTSASQFVNSDAGVYASSYTLNNDGSLTLSDRYNSFFVVVDIVNTSNSYFFLTLSYSQPTAYYTYLRVYDFNNSSFIFGGTISEYSGLAKFMGSNSAQALNFNLATGKYVFYLDGSGAITLSNIKLEKWDIDLSTVSIAMVGFTGFVIPNYTYRPEPSPYDSWDGVVRPNYINSPDFYNYPVFVESYSNLSDSYKNKWLSNMDRYFYDYNGPDTLGSFKMDVHAYGFNEDDAFLYYYDNYADSFDFSGINAHFRLALNSEVAGTVSLTSGGGSVSDRFDVGGSIVDLTLPDSYTTSFIAISVVFDHYPDLQNKSCTLYYSKLEYGTIFTGYVIPDHIVPSAVQDNILNNYDFSSVPLPSDSPRVGAWWYLYHDEQGIPGEHDEDISFSSEYGGLTFDATPALSSGIIYFTYAVPSSEDFDSSGSYVFTVSLWSRSPYGQSVIFSATDGAHDVHYRSVFPASGGPELYSFRFPKINGVILSLEFPVTNGIPNTIYYAKLESSSFTGFCGNFAEFYDNGYNAGYSEGYSRGSEAYGTSLYTLNFNQPDSYTTLYDFGWRNMGFDDIDSMFASTMTFDYIGFYRSLGYAIAVQKYVDVPAESLRRLYASADINFNVSNISVAQDYVMLELSEYTSRLVIVNAQYPNDYTPEVYPSYRVVRVNVQRGLSNILDSYGDSKYEEGRLAGYDQGYMQGEADGERRGYSQATQVAMNGTGGWFGFISAFIDVPIKALTSLLDFDFFGFNLLNIIKIFLVFSLVYLVIRLITKGKVAQ